MKQINLNASPTSVLESIWATFTTQSNKLFGSSIPPSREELNVFKSIPQNTEEGKKAYRLI